MSIKRIKGSMIMALASVVCLSTLIGDDGSQSHSVEQQSKGWPTFRGDTSQSSVSFSRLPGRMHRQWIYQAAHEPSPAWPPPSKQNWSARSGPLSPTVTYDRAFQTVLQDNKLYFGSSTDDTVYCLDSETGRLLWNFVTEGPVRLAPVCYNSNVYVGSDDGYLYCLDGETGGLRWRYRAAEKDIRLPGNGRMISNAPIRSGIAIDKNIAYFTAGLFPLQGVYLIALNVESGEEIWKKKINCSPQGYIALSKNKIYVPTGRTPYVTFQRADGKHRGSLGRSNSWDKNLVGGSYAMVLDEHIVTGPSEDGQLHIFNTVKKSPIIRNIGIQMITQDNDLLILRKDSLSCFDKKEFLDNKKVEKWRTACSGALNMVRAANCIVVGQKNKVSAFDLTTGNKLWNDTIDGRIEGLAVANDHLYATTNSGKIYCYGADKIAEPALLKQSKLRTEKHTYDGLTNSTLQLIKASGFDKGYCLVLNAGKGQLCYDIALNTNMRVIGIEKSPEAIKEARKMLKKKGLYGARVVIHQAQDSRLPYRNYLFNAIISNRIEYKQQYKPEELWRVLRPNGGVLAFLGPNSVNSKRTLKRMGSSIPKWKLRKRDNNIFGYGIRPALKKSGEWSHCYADYGNSAASKDEIQYKNMAIQWFGRPGPRNMADRHLKQPPPLYSNGYLYISGKDYIAALDGYNGTVLWEKNVKNSGRVAVMRDCGNMVAQGNNLYIANGSSCTAYDSQSGEERLTIDLEKDKQWAYIALVNNRLIGSETDRGTSFSPVFADKSYENHKSMYNTLTFRGIGPFACSHRIFSHNPDNGRKLWDYKSKGVIINPAIACTKDQVVFVECGDENLSKGERRIDAGRLFQSNENRLVALNINTGHINWAISLDLSLFQWSLFLSATDNEIIVSGSRHAMIGKDKRNRYDMLVFKARDGKKMWKSLEVPTQDTYFKSRHGEANQHPAIVGDIIYGTGYARYISSGKPYEGWKWEKGKKCGSVSMSKNIAFSRFGRGLNPYMFDLISGDNMPLTTVTRPGCWINILPVGGMILIPEASSGCTCGFSIQSSIALSPREE